MAVKMVATNKQARRNYEITETFEAGIVLAGAEVKALRESNVKLNDAYARFENKENTRGFLNFIAHWLGRGPCEAYQSPDFFGGAAASCLQSGGTFHPFLVQ